MITKELIIEAYTHLLTTNQSLPDEVLDFIKDAALEKLEKLEWQKQAYNLPKIDWKGFDENISFRPWRLR